MLAPLRDFGKTEMKPWWKKWPRGGSAAQPRVWSSVLGIVLGVPEVSTRGEQRAAHSR